MILPGKLEERGAGKTIRRKVNDIIGWLKANQLQPSASTRLTKTSSGTLVHVRKAAKAGVAAPEPYKITAIKLAYLECTHVVSGVASNIAKPYHLRPDNWDDDNSDSVTYENTDTTGGLTRTLTGTFGGTELTGKETVFPAYKVDGLVFAVTNDMAGTEWTLLDGDSAEITLHDDNRDGRHFRMERNAVSLCLNDKIEKQLFPSGIATVTP